MITVPFYEMIDTDSEIWRLINKQRFPSLYPPNTLSDEIIENINVYFYDRQIAYSSPERFVMQWWRLIKERAYAWTKLLETEKVLRDDDMLFNYDLTEDSTDNRTGSGSSQTKNTPNLRTLNSPDLLTTQNESSNQKTGMTQSGENTDDYNQTSREMDTPDGITGDINNYLSKASTQQEGTSTRNSTPFLDCWIQQIVWMTNMLDGINVGNTEWAKIKQTLPPIQEMTIPTISGDMEISEQ